jgi:SAM-dependent methyltransferase
LGADAEYIAGRGFKTVAFDISETTIRVARRRHPASTVDYQVADLLNPPPRWQDAFALVIEIITVQALPDPPRHQAIVNISRLVGEDGTLLVIAAAPDANQASSELPPWPLDEDEIKAFASDRLTPKSIEIIPLPDSRSLRCWRADLFRAS